MRPTTLRVGSYSAKIKSFSDLIGYLSSLRSFFENFDEPIKIEITLGEGGDEQ